MKEIIDDYTTIAKRFEKPTGIYRDHEYLIWLNPNMFAYCGYIKIPNTHPWINEEKRDDIFVHGGITFFEKLNNGDTWIGFDCLHFGDFIPTLHKYLPKDSMLKIWRENDVLEEIKSLIDQCIEVIE